MALHSHLHNIEREIENGLSQEATMYTLAPPLSETNMALPPHSTLPTAAEAASLPPSTEVHHGHHLGGIENRSAMESRTTTLGPDSPPRKASHDADAQTVENERALAPHAEPQLEGEKLRTTDSGELEKGKAPKDEVDHSGLLTGARLFLVFLALMLSVFMFALDQSIVSTAIPQIVSEFQAFDQVAWIITGYFLTQCGLILLVGQLLTVIKAKWILLAAIFFFELGSLLCAVSQGMGLLIFARAVQGVGAAGLFVSILAVIATITTLEQRPAFMAAFGIVFVISSVVGPLLGGVFTERVSWRWCFWINLPFGAFATAAVIFLLPAHEPKKEAVGDSAAAEVPGWRKILRMDFIGAAIVLCLITCLLLALQWGGNEYAWSSWRIIFLFCLGGALIPVFALWQWKLDKRALIPLSLLKNRTQVACAGAMFFFMMGMLGGTYQLPLFYQAGRQHSPQQSGIDIIAFMLAICIGIFISGGMTTKFGRYYPFLIIGPPISAIGFGLLYTITADISNAKIIGFQILAGFGIGLSFQNALIAIQAEYHDRPYLIPQATGVVSFFQLTGAAIGIGLINTVQSVFLNEELQVLAPDAPFELVRNSVSAIYSLPAAEQAPVIEAYIIAITKSFIPIIAGICLAWIIAAFVRNHDMRKIGGAAVAAV